MHNAVLDILLSSQKEASFGRNRTTESPDARDQILG
jgi:hypothetical protein